MNDTQKNIKKLQDFVQEVLESDDANFKEFSEERDRRISFWTTLKLLRTEYQVTHYEFDAYDFEKWVEEHYGIKLNFVDGNIGGDYQVVDEKKYLVYVLKFK
jgi:hypothetical protein